MLVRRFSSVSFLLPMAAVILGLSMLLSLGAGLSGCSPQDKSTVIVAEVGDRSIMLDYFERKMNTMDPQFIPPDIDTEEGREKLLEVMINKEVMAIKAEELGFGQEESVEKSADAITTYAAVSKMKADVVEGTDIYTEEEIFDYYENFARKIQINFMLFDHQDQAVEGKKLVEGGEEWKAVADRLSVGFPGPNGDYSMQMNYGSVVDALEQPVFAAAVGDIVGPIETIYGYFVIRINGQSVERVKPLDELRASIIQSLQKQKADKATIQFMDEIFEKYELTLNEDALDVIFDSLPEDWPLVPPPSKEELPEMKIPADKMNMELMRFRDDPVETSYSVWDLKSYSAFYEESAALARPRRERRIGALRRSFKELVLRELLPVEARARGYMDTPEVLDQRKERREQAMVSLLYGELIKDTVQVGPSELEAYYNEHRADYIQPEKRDVLALVAASEEDALAAKVLVEGGGEWSDALENYGIDGDVKMQGGKMGVFTPEDQNAFSEIAFQISGEGQISYPKEMAEGQWLIVQCAQIIPFHEPTYEEARMHVGKVMKAEMEEEAFKQKVDEWKSSMTIQRYPDRLMDAAFDPQPRDTSMDLMQGDAFQAQQ